MAKGRTMETDVAGRIGAERHERTAHRNGSRTRRGTRAWTNRAAIPSMTPGTYVWSLRQPAEAITSDGDRQVVGVDVGPSEDPPSGRRVCKAS